MADHEKIKQLCEESLDRVLTGEEQGLLDAHLAGCPDCAAYLADLQFMAAALGKEPEPPVGLHEKIMDGIVGETRQSTVVQIHTPGRRLPMVSAMVAAAACVALVLSGVAGDAISNLRLGASGGGMSGAAADSAAMMNNAPAASPSGDSGGVMEESIADSAPAAIENGSEPAENPVAGGDMASAKMTPGPQGRAAVPQTATTADMAEYDSASDLENALSADGGTFPQMAGGVQSGRAPQVGAFVSSVMKGEVFAGCYLVEGGEALPEIGQAQQRDEYFAYYVVENNLSQLETLLDSLEKAGCTVRVYEEEGLVFNTGAAKIIIVVRL